MIAKKFLFNTALLYSKQFLIIILFYALGEALSYLLPFSFPGAIIGMGLLFMALSLKLVKIYDIKIVTDFFLKYMALFFIPAGVSVMSSYGLIEQHIISIISLLLIATVFMLGFVALVVQFFINKIGDV